MAPYRIRGSVVPRADAGPLCGVVEKVAMRREENEAYINEIIQLFYDRFGKAGIPAKIKGRVKHYYSIYQKIIRQKVPFEQVHDVIGIRIITDTLAHCYDILGIIHSLWPLVPGRFKDFISLPKSNMYQSLHTTVMGPSGERVEFQIRTKEMDAIAEEGIAAHWRYKEKDRTDKKNEQQVKWLRDLVKEISDAKEFLEAVKGEVVPIPSMSLRRAATSRSFRSIPRQSISPTAFIRQWETNASGPR